MTPSDPSQSKSEIAGPAERASKLMKEGPYAFPFNMQDGKGGEFGCPGMTIRDYFAAQALAGEFAAQDEVTGIITDGTTDQWMLDRAKTFYRMADAMLRARG